MPEPTLNTLQNSQLLLTFLQQQYKELQSLKAQLQLAQSQQSQSSGPLTQSQLNQIRTSLQANGVAQINVQNILGVLAQPQNASIQTFPLLPDPTNPIYQKDAAIIVSGVLYVNNGSSWVAFSVGITSITISGGTTGLTGGTITSAGTITIAGILNATHGGTGIDTHTSTGIPSIAGGTWSVLSNTLNTATDGSSTATFTANMIGSTGGPVTAAQNGWLKLKDSGGATIWIPVWK